MLLRVLLPTLILVSCASRAHAAALRICDTKKALNDSLIPAASVPSLLDKLVTAMHCDALRVPIMPSMRSPSQNPAAFNETVAFAAARGLALYASPMEGAWRAAPSEKSYARWVADYAKAFSPHFLSVFNEVGASNCDTACMQRVVATVRGALPAPLPLFVGPDAEHVSSSISAAAAAPGHFAFFDILSSHNAGADSSNTLAAWQRLAVLAGARPMWSSENPACFALAECTAYGTMASALKANASALVSWDTLGSDVNLTGAVTDKGVDVAAGW